MSIVSEGIVLTLMLTFLPFSLEYIGDEYYYDGMEDENDKTIFKAMNRLLM